MENIDMYGRDELCRLFYADVMFNEYTRSNAFLPQRMEEKLLGIVKQSKELSLESIEAEVLNIDSKSGPWYNLYKGKSCTKEKISTGKLVIEAAHNNMDGIENCSGKKLSDFLEKNQNNEDVLDRLRFVLRYFDTFKKYLPIIVRQSGENFEVMLGNHRAMAHLKKGLCEIDAFVIK